MTHRILATLAFAAAAGASLPQAANAQAMAGKPMAMPVGHEETITGTVIDVSCKFGQGLTGAEHTICAGICADKGLPLAILTADGKLYIPISPAMPGDAQNAALKQYAEKKVKVSGKVFTAGGAQAVEITAIAPAA